MLQPACPPCNSVSERRGGLRGEPWLGSVSMRVLLVEDHKPLVKALKRGIEEEGFAVDTAEDGEEGNYKARTANYDVIVLDLMLPKMDGLSLLKEWRRNGLKTHVLVLTAKDTTA